MSEREVDTVMEEFPIIDGPEEIGGIEDFPKIKVTQEQVEAAREALKELKNRITKLLSRPKNPIPPKPGHK